MKGKAMRFSLEDIKDADDEGDGFCLVCGERQSGVEPDAQGYQCEACGRTEVYGAAEIALMGLAD